ncbi:MAG: hypothetical protein OXC41_03570 [Gammaproteobacteria bacterium]|nr:hypothetical protein [Gammaproteobacteria bacterium]
MNVNQKISVDLVKYQKAMNFSAKKDVRYYLLGVCIQPCPIGGTMIVATDGHVLGAFHDPKGQCDDEVILSLDKRDLTQYIKEGAVRATIERKDENQVEIALFNKHQCDYQHEIRKAWYGKDVVIDGRFPEWQRIVPSDLPETDQPLSNGVRVGNLDKFRFTKVASKEGAGIRMYPTDKDSAVLVFIDNEPDFVGVVMPTKWDQENKGSWWFKLKKQQTQEALKEAA